MNAGSSDHFRLLRAYRRFLEHAADAAELSPEELLRMRESETFFSLGDETLPRQQATESLRAVQARAEQLYDQESLRFALALILETIAANRALRRQEVAAAERVEALEKEVARLRERGFYPPAEPEPPPSFFKPSRRMVEFIVGTVPRRYLQRIVALRDVEERSTAAAAGDDPAAAIASLYERQLKRRRRMSARAAVRPLRRRWTEVELPAPDQLDAADIERLATRVSRSLQNALAALAGEPPPKNAWGWTARDLARALSRDLGFGILATRLLAREFFRWLDREAGGVYRLPWGSLHLIDKRRLVIQEGEDRAPAVAPRLRAAPVRLLAAE